jgi:hypothetical protein
MDGGPEPDDAHGSPDAHDDAPGAPPGEPAPTTPGRSPDLIEMLADGVPFAVARDLRAIATRARHTSGVPSRPIRRVSRTLPPP